MVPTLVFFWDSSFDEKVTENLSLAIKSAASPLLSLFSASIGDDLKTKIDRPLFN